MVGSSTYVMDPDLVGMVSYVMVSYPDGVLTYE
jgi:hypothetical protein